MKTRLIWSAVAVALGMLTLALARDGASAPRPVSQLMLHTRFVFNQGDKADVEIPGLMTRELARQAFLIAAREELGMRTFDASLREQPASADGADVLSLLLTVESASDGEFTIYVYECDAPLSVGAPRLEKNDAIWKTTIKYDRAAEKLTASLASELEKLSRDAFAEQLRKLGGVAAMKAAVEALSGEASPTEAQADAAVDARIDVESLLSEVDSISQFVAVRELHRRLREGPVGDASAESLSQLARGYANLGILSETSWGPAPQALLARGLLYAQRLQATNPDDEQMRWTRGYVYAVSGLHNDALALLDNGPKPAAVEAATPPPGWSRLALPYCKFDTLALAEITEEKIPASRWAAYLRAWAVFGQHEDRLFGETLREAIAACPEALNLYGLGTRGQPLGIKRQVASLEAKALLLLTPARLQQTPAIPEAVVESSREPDSTKPPGIFWDRITQAIDQAESAQDPSWSVLATLLEDQGLRTAVNALRVDGDAVEHDQEPLAEFWSPFAKRHPDGDFIRVAGLLRAGKPQELQRAAARLRFRDPSRWMADSVRSTWSLPNQWGESIGDQAWCVAGREFTAQNLSYCLSITSFTEDLQQTIAGELKRISPRSPLALIGEIQSALQDSAPITDEQLEQWEAKAGESPTAWRRLAEAHQKLGREQATVRCYENSIDLSPEAETIHGLAWALERFKRFDEVVPAFKRHLDEEDYGIGHSNTHYEIANYLIRRDDAKAAKSHAIAAAEAYSGRGLEVAGRTCELLGQTDEADQWYERLSRSYPTYSGMSWYLYRQRIGDIERLDEARQLAERNIAGMGNWVTRDEWWPVAYYLLEEKYELVNESLRARAGNDAAWYSEGLRLMVAVITGDKHEEKLARGALERYREQSGHAWLAEYNEMIDAARTASSQETDDNEKQEGGDRADKVLAYLKKYKGDSNAAFECNACYILGRIIEARGIPEKAATCYDQAVATRSQVSITWTLARARQPAAEAPYPAEQ